MFRLCTTILLSFLVLSGLSTAATFSVTSTHDVSDAAPGDGLCEAADMSGCTLRAALDEANSLAGPDTIVISPGLGSISLIEGALELLDNGTYLRCAQGDLTIDGFQNIAGEPLLDVASDSNRIVGLVLQRSRTDGILISGSHNLVGGPSESESMVLIQNGLDAVVSAGIRISGNAAVGNCLTNCSIGTDLAGGAAMPNQFGVILEQQASQSKIDRCHLSGNSSWGILLQSGAHDNTGAGSLIGVDRSGLYALANTDGGVLIRSGAINNTIGSLDGPPLNIISGNGGDGVRITGPGTSGNIVIGSVIGLDISAVTSLGNNGAGVHLDAACTGNFIGGSEPGARNLIGANWLDGVLIEQTGTSSNSVIGNWIGIAANAFRARSNGLIEGNGVTIRAGASDNEVGGLLSGERNVIAGEQAAAILLTGNGTSQNSIRGNFIGVNPTGQYSFYNGSGVIIRGGASHNLVGGTTPVDRNIISGSANQTYPFGGGVMLYDEGTSFNRVEGNYIGVNATGSSISPNATAGVVIGNGASNNTIGGDSSGAGNLISGNGYGMLMLGLGRGIHIEGPGTSGNSILGNHIGTTADGSGGLRNFGHGVAIVNGASDNTIGGQFASATNTIAFNRYHGIFINDPNTIHNSIRHNAIFNNDSAGIVIAGGAQEGILPPIIISAGGWGVLRIKGTVSGSLGKVDLYRSAPDFTGAGEPRQYYGTIYVEADGTWEAETSSPDITDTITAIYLDTLGNSSACAQNVLLDFVSDVGDDQPTLPTEFRLSQNYPNPFNPTTEIQFSLPSASQIRVSVYNTLGQRVALLIDGRYPAGDHLVRWDGSNEAGLPVASGVYFYRLESSDRVLSRKMLLLK